MALLMLGPHYPDREEHTQTTFSVYWGYDARAADLGGCFANSLDDRIPQKVGDRRENEMD